MTTMHTERYGDVTNVPASVLASIASFVENGWGDYEMGYVATSTVGSAPQTFTYVYQVKAPDGSRFAVGCSRWGRPFELKGTGWLAFLQVHGIEATLSGVRS